MAARKTEAADPRTLLALIGSVYTFGRALDAKIAAAVALPKPNPNPMEDVPSFVDRSRMMTKHLRITDHDTVLVGCVQGYDVWLRRAASGRGYFQWGCRTFASEHSARKHFRGGRSATSGLRRPQATVLIDYVASLMAHLGWTW